MRYDWIWIGFGFGIAKQKSGVASRAAKVCPVCADLRVVYLREVVGVTLKNTLYRKQTE